jgi:hypothetical protein
MPPAAAESAAAAVTAAVTPRAAALDRVAQRAAPLIVVATAQAAEVTPRGDVDAAGGIDRQHLIHHHSRPYCEIEIPDRMAQPASVHDLRRGRAQEPRRSARARSASTRSTFAPPRRAKCVTCSDAE